MKRPKLQVLLLTLCVYCAQAQVTSQPEATVQKEIFFPKPVAWRVSAGIGTMGAHLGVTRRVSARGLLNLFVDNRFFNSSLSHKWRKEKLRTDYDMRTWIAGASYDWFPFSGITHSALAKALRIRGGIQYMFNSTYEFRSRAAGDITAAGYIFTPEEIGTMHTTVTTSKLQPFVGAGLDRSFPKSRFSLGADAGLMHQGKPQVRMVGSYMLENTATQASLVQKNMRAYRIFPYARLSLHYNL